MSLKCRLIFRSLPLLQLYPCYMPSYHIFPNLLSINHKFTHFYYFHGVSNCCTEDEEMMDYFEEFF
jgi:hypothetical protein